MLHLSAALGGAADRVADAIGGGDPAWLVAAVCLHLTGQLARSSAWLRALRACWPDVARRRASAWYLCGAGLSGVLSGRGGDAVRLALARREIPGATWPALAGTALVEGGIQALAGLAPTLVAVAIGVGALPAPSPPVAAAVVVAIAAVAALARRSPRTRRAVGELGRGCAALRGPDRCVLPMLGWEVAGRALRLASVACFLRAFGLDASVAAVVTVSVLYGSGTSLPLPGAGTAAAAGALLVALPAVSGGTPDMAAVTALVVVQPLLLTAVGVSTSLLLLAALLGVRTPRALRDAARALQAAPAAPLPETSAAP